MSSHGSSLLDHSDYSIAENFAKIPLACAVLLPGNSMPPPWIHSRSPSQNEKSHKKSAPPLRDEDDELAWRERVVLQPSTDQQLPTSKKNTAHFKVPCASWVMMCLGDLKISQNRMINDQLLNSNPLGTVMLLMAEILRSLVEVGSLSHYLQGFIYTSQVVCPISSINSSTKQFWVPIHSHLWPLDAPWGVPQWSLQHGGRKYQRPKATSLGSKSPPWASPDLQSIEYRYSNGGHIEGIMKFGSYYWAKITIPYSIPIQFEHGALYNTTPPKRKE